MSQKVNKRILHIMSSHGGGISTFIRNLATEIHRFGIVFDVVTYGPCPPEFVEAIRRTGGDVYQIKNPKKKDGDSFTNHSHVSLSYIIMMLSIVI